MNHFVGFRRRRAVRAFGNDPDLLRNLLHVGRGHLILNCVRHQDVHVLFNPGVAWQHVVPEALGFVLVNPAEAIRDAHQLAKIDTLQLAIGVRRLIALIPARYARDRPTQLLVQLNRVLRYVSESLHAGDSVLRLHAQFFQCLAQGVDHTIARGFRAAE